MAAKKVEEFLLGVRLRAKALGERFDESSVWALRSDLFALRAYLAANPNVAKAGVGPALDRAIALSSTVHAFVSELRGFHAQKEASERASFMDLGAIGILAVENVLTADRVTLPRIVMSALAEALVFLASRQYVGGSSEVLAGLYRQHAAAMQAELWALASDYRGKVTAKDAAEVREGIDGFFAKLEADGIPVEARVAVLHQVYGLLLALRSAELLTAGERETRPPSAAKRLSKPP